MFDNEFFQDIQSTHINDIQLIISMNKLFDLQKSIFQVWILNFISTSFPKTMKISLHSNKKSIKCHIPQNWNINQLVYSFVS